MRWFRRVCSWAIELLAVAVLARWVLVYLRRVLILPTQSTTPPLGPAEVSPMMRRLIVSDLHMGGGDRLDDFAADRELVDFIRHYAISDEPTELILAGDTFEFLQVRIPGLGDYDWSADAAGQRFLVILSAHPEPIAALRDFIAFPTNQLTLLIGNHDFELHYSTVKHLLRQALNLGDADGRLRFALTYEGGGVYLEHGNQFDPWNRFVHFEGISEPFEVVRGTRVVKDVINLLEDDPLEVAPLIDNVKPTSAFFWYMLALPRLRQPDARRFVVRGLLRLFRTVALPQAYRRRPLLGVREELLGAPGETFQRELALQAVYNLDPALRQAAAAYYGGTEPEVQIRPRTLLRTTQLAQTFARRFVGERDGSDASLEKIEQEATRQLRREIREFKGALLRGMAQIAARPEHRSNRLFVCGHTHLAEVVALNETQMYVNIGTWTTIVLDMRTNRRQEQRFPFLEVRYPSADGVPKGTLLVWRSSVEPVLPWVGVRDEEEDERL